MLRVTALMDNKPSGQKALIHEHGLSYLMEGRGYRFLFDCGAGPNPIENAHHLGRSLRDLDAVVLSHSHYDHAGGYRYLLEQGGGSDVLYTGPGFFAPKFAVDGWKYTDLSAGFDRAFLEAHGVTHREVRDVMELFPGVYLIGNFPRRNAFETIPPRFVRLTEKGFEADDFGDEICVAVDLGGKLALFVGCAHPGILNMAQRVGQALNLPIYAIFGGTHLVEADRERVEQTVQQLREMGLELFGLGHCTGNEAECLIRQNPDLKSCHLGAGDCVFLEER